MVKSVVNLYRLDSFFVRELPRLGDMGQASPVVAATPFAAASAGQPRRPIDATALIRGMFHKVSNKPQPGMGVFPPEWLETTFMPAAVRRRSHPRAGHREQNPAARRRSGDG